MIVQKGDTIVFQSFYTVDGVGETGLTVTADIYRNGVSVATDEAATDAGGGLYTASYASTATAGRYTAVFKTADVTVDVKQKEDTVWVGSTWVENIDAVVSDIPDDTWAVTTRELTGITVSVSNTVAKNISYSLNVTTDYTDANDNALFAGVIFPVQFDLTAATIALNIIGPGTPFSKAGVAVDTNSAYVELEASELATLSRDELYYELIAELATDQTIVLATGTIRVTG